jgi:hypothetical protein
MGIIGQRAQEIMIRPGDILEIQGMVARVHDLYDEDRNYRESPTRLMMCAPESDVLEIRMAGSASGSVSKSP